MGYRYDAPLRRRLWWHFTDCAGVFGIVLAVVCIIFLCAIVLGLAVRVSFWAAGIDW